jgi:hypothetical protein
MSSSLLSRNRFACLLLTGVMFVLPSPAAADVSIVQSANGATMTVTASSARFAGAISSLTFRNVQYVNIADHGREIQSALQLDGFGECLNPTEAGSKADGTSLNSSSVLLSISNTGNVLTTQNRPAYWLLPGENYGQVCGSTTATTAQNQTVLSNYTISRTTSFYPSIPNLIQTDNRFTIPEDRSSASIEAITGYLPSTFNSWLRYDRGSRTLVKLTGTSSMQTTTVPLIAAQSNGQHAMGVISPGITGADPGQAYYAYFTFGGATATTKWSCVYGHGAITAGTQLTYTCLMAVGTVDEVIAALNAYPMPGQTLSSMVPIYRFYKYPQHFMTLSYSEGAGAGFTFETTGFHLFPSGGSGYQALYRCYNPWSHDHFVSTQSTCEGFNQEGTLGYAATQSAQNLVPLYRFFRSNTSDHLITVNYSEGSSNGYTYEGTLGYVTY